jgi:FdhE protein
MTRDDWLSKHPYLRPVADLHALVDEAAAEVSVPTAPMPDWDDYVGEFHAGVPLLRSSRAAIDLGPAQSVVLSLIEKLLSKPLPGTLSEQCRALNADRHSDPESRRFAIAGSISEDPLPPAQAGLLRYLGWTILVRYLRPLVTAFGAWRDEERWLRSYCPTCGEPPAMAQLVGKDPGRLRLLSCGCCRTRWRYRRTGCPFCDSQNDHRLAVLAITGEDGLRIDYCERCSGYLKTYDGEGSESVLLADWTSLHLDLLARDRGLKRLAASLYDL